MNLTTGLLVTLDIRRRIIIFIGLYDFICAPRVRLKYEFHDDADFHAAPWPCHIAGREDARLFRRIYAPTKSGQIGHFTPQQSSWGTMTCRRCFASGGARWNFFLS